MNKKTIFVLFILLFIPGILYAGMFDVIKGKDTGTKVDVNVLSARSLATMIKVHTATIAFAEAVVKSQLAVGKKAEAEKLQAAIDNAKAKKDDTESTKVLVADLNNATDDINKVDFQSQMDKAKAKAFLGNAILNVGAGILLDGLAVNDARNLLKETKDQLSSFSLATVGKANDIINVSQFVVQTVPPQSNSMRVFSQKMVQYAKTNGIPVPSKEDIEKKLKDMEKE